MKTLISLISLAALSFSTLAFASTDEEVKLKNQYLISAKILRDGAVWSSPKIMALDGEEAVIETADADGTKLMKLSIEPKSFKKFPDQVRLKTYFSQREGGTEVKYKSRMVLKDDGTEVVIPLAVANEHQYTMHLSVERK